MADTQEKQSDRGRSLEKSTDFILSQHLWLKILIGMILGTVIGLVLSPDSYDLLNKTGLSLYVSPFTLGEWLAIPGVVFLGLTQMVIIPLVLCSIILGIAESGNLGSIKRLSLQIIPYFILTTFVAICIGVFLVNTVRPGDLIDQQSIDHVMSSEIIKETTPTKTFEHLTIPQRISNMIPRNPAQAQVERNMLQLVIAAILVGIALLTIPRKSANPLLDLCVSGQVISMRIISWAMVIAPYAVFGLLCNVMIKMGVDALESLGLYVMTVLTGLGCMMMVYLGMVRILAYRPIGKFMTGIREAQLIAFSTSSSGATMPVSIHCAEDNLGIKQDVSRFVIPLGATINMDGTAMYQAIAAIFLCQVFGIYLSTEETILLMLTTVGASIGTPATPGVGIVVLSTILIGIGVPPEGIALILGVDRLLDMCRTTVNVTGDLTAASVMHRWMGYKNKRGHNIATA